MLHNFTKKLFFITALVSSTYATAQTSVTISAINAVNASGFVNAANVNTSGDIKNLQQGMNRGYITFNLNSLPNGAVITAAVLTVNVPVTTGFNSTNANGRVAFVNKNSTQANIDFNDISSGTLIGNLSMDGQPGSKVININAAGVQALNSKLGGAMCFGLQAPTTAGAYSTISGYNSTNAAAGPPSLQITYTTAAPKKANPDFFASKTTIHIDSLVKLFDNSGNSPTRWTWNYGDGTSSPNNTAKNVTHKYANTGLYSITLTVGNSVGDTLLTKTDYIQVVGNPVADFKADTTTIFVGGTVTFTDSSTNFPSTYSWDFGDAGISNAPNPAHIYDSIGVFTVSLTVGGQFGGTGSLTKTNYINVLDTPSAPIANFNFTANALNVSFSDSSLNLPDSYLYFFGDGDSSFAKNPIHTYAAYDTFEVKLIVKNIKGSDTISKTIILTAPQIAKPVAAFDFSKSDKSLSFTDKSTGTTTTYSWTFGDGNTSTSQNPTHLYANYDTYTVKLVVCNAGGCDSTSKTITITAPAPNANFDAVIAGKKVTITDKSSPVPTSYSWNFGDSSTSTEANPTHTYATNGTYTITLIACNEGSCDTVAKEVIINVANPAAKPTANFKAGTPVSGSVAFTDQSTDAPTSWAWSFGNGATSTLQNPSNTYTASGTYNVRLIAKNANGSDTITKPVTIVIAGVNNKSAKLSIYPNPANEQINFTLPNKNMAANINVYDINGKNISLNISTNGSLDISELNSGTYMLIIIDKNQNQYNSIFIKD